MDYYNWQLGVRLVRSSMLELCSVRVLIYVDIVLPSLHHYRAKNSHDRAQEAGERALTCTVHIWRVELELMLIYFS